MTPALTLLLLASLASFAAVWSPARAAFRGQPASVASGRAFVAFALWTILGGLIHSPALVAAAAIALIVTSLALSLRALLGDAFGSRDRTPRARAHVRTVSP